MLLLLLLLRNLGRRRRNEKEGDEEDARHLTFTKGKRNLEGKRKEKKKEEEGREKKNSCWSCGASFQKGIKKSRGGGKERKEGPSS